jgi:hypothetical protein
MCNEIDMSDVSFLKDVNEFRSWNGTGNAPDDTTTETQPTKQFAPRRLFEIASRFV